MDIEEYEKARNAIDDIVFKAKVPIIVMVAILEIAKHSLLTGHIVDWKAEQTVKALDALQKKAEEARVNKGVS